MSMIERTSAHNQTSINHFYLFVQAEAKEKKSEIDKTAFKILETVPGEWKKLSDWEGTFFGFYPNLSTSEREQEISINVKVRLPLKDKLKECLTPVMPGALLDVHVIITRACFYSVK